MAAPTGNLNSLHYDEAGEVQTGTVIVKGFTWTGSTGAADQLTFKNSAGSIVIGPYTAGIIGNVVHVMFPRDAYIKANGLEADVLTAGEVDVYI